jgi:thioester reductase-like protein
MSNQILLTGCTGLLGQYLLRDLLLEGVPLAVLIRAKKDEPAAERLNQVVGYWEGELGRPLPRPACLEGDITLPGLGLSGRDRGWVARNCGSVLHNAASLAFVGKDRAKDPWLSNLTGTANVLDLCRHARLRELHYVSTAYVCGLRTGQIREDEFDCVQEFRNDYENAKFEAEKLVRAADFLDRATVYRPAIIIGDSRSGYTTTYHGLYAYLYFGYLYTHLQPRDPDGRLRADLRLNLTGDERRNLVPVDWVSAVTAHVLQRPELHGRTYHLTPLQPVTARELKAALTRGFNIYGPVFAGPDALRNGDLNDLEKMFYEYVAQYQPYWNEEPRFDCCNTRSAAPHLPCPPVDAACLGRLIDFAVRDQWGKGKKKKPRPATPAIAVDAPGSAAPQPSE